MFGIDFSEFLLIGIVALIVLGPERLPRVARALGHIVGRMQRYAASLKAEIDREMKLEELTKLQEQFRQAEASARHVILEEKHTVEEGAKSISSAADLGAQSAPPVVEPKNPEQHAS